MGYIRGRKREEKIKETNEETPPIVKVCSSDRKNAGIIVFQAGGRGMEPFLFMWKGVAGEKF